MLLITCEQSGEWAASSRRWVPANVRLVETRSLTEMWEHIEHGTRSVVVIEFTTAKSEAILAALAKLNRAFGGITAVVVMARDLRRWEPILREAGAVLIICSPRRLQTIGEIVERRVRSSTPAQPEGNDIRALKERILASLPWTA
jgi:hypothetical protein